MTEAITEIPGTAASSPSVVDSFSSTPIEGPSPVVPKSITPSAPCEHTHSAWVASARMSTEPSTANGVTNGTYRFEIICCSLVLTMRQP